MANVSIARRYARALIDVGTETQKLDVFGEQLERFGRALQQSPELSDVMVNPAYGRSERATIVGAVMKSIGGFDAELENFLKLLVDRNRMGLLPDIARLYRDLADARAGRIRGRVSSAVPLEKATVDKIADIFAARTQRKVVLETKVDPHLLGGVATQVGPVLYDGSLRTQLEELRRTLRAG